MPKLLHVVGARPNFMKIAPLLRVLEKRKGFHNTLVHTGQHYDEEMSGSFLRDLAIPEPDRNLRIGSGSHASQTAGVLVAMEEVLKETCPDLLVVVGDVNSTLASALAASKLGVAIAHVEAGLRSGDRSMPEEINRVLTDQLSDLCLTPSRDADENLKAEGVHPERIHFVGNIMIDSLHFSLRKVDRDNMLQRYGVREREYGLVTLHRPSNVDHETVLRSILRALDQIAAELPLLFPVHPRTQARMRDFGIALAKVRLVDPIPYLDMIGLLDNAACILTDSGGLQEESTALGVPCLTLRSSTERPITISEGTNTLVPDRSTSSILNAFESLGSRGDWSNAPERWDGRTASRIADVFEGWLGMSPRHRGLSSWSLGRPAHEPGGER